MRYKAVISDWNGTAFGPLVDEELGKWVILASLGYDFRKGEYSRFLSDLCRSISAKRMLDGYRRGEDTIPGIQRALDGIMAGKPLSLVYAAAAEYAKAHTGEVDSRVLRPMRKARNEGMQTGILSASYDFIIIRLLQESGFMDTFNYITADRLEADCGIVRSLNHRIYGRKAETMKSEFFDKRGLDDSSTAYIGDSGDDIPVAEILKPGSFIVSLIAPEEFKNKMACKYGARVPESEEEIEGIVFG